MANSRLFHLQLEPVDDVEGSHPHHQVVYTIPRMLRILLKYKRRLLGELCRCAPRSFTRYFEVTTGSKLMPGVIAAIQTSGDRINLHSHLHFLVTEGGVDEAPLRLISPTRMS